MTDVLGLHRTGSRISVTSIASVVENVNTREAYKEFCGNLHRIGVTEDMIRQKEREILKILRPQGMVAGSQVGGSNIRNQGQFLGAGFSNAEIPLYMSSRRDNNDPSSKKFRPPSRLTLRLNRIRSGFRSSLNLPPSDSPPLDSSPLDSSPLDSSPLNSLPLDSSPIDPSPMNLEDNLLSPIEAEVQDTEYSMDSPQTDLETDLLPVATEQPDTGCLIPVSTEAQDSERLIPTLTAASDTKSLLDTDIIASTPLHLAARNGHTDTVELLLGEGASIESRDGYNNTPLHLAVLNGHCGVVELLLGKGASVESRGGGNDTPLHLAALDGHSDIVELLLRKGALIEAMDEDNDTPMHCAAYGGHSGTVELLLMEGASIEARNIHNDTPIHRAARQGHTATVKLLINKGAKFDSF